MPNHNDDEDKDDELQEPGNASLEDEEMGLDEDEDPFDVFDDEDEEDLFANEDEELSAAASNMPENSPAPSTDSNAEQQDANEDQHPEPEHSIESGLEAAIPALAGAAAFAHAIKPKADVQNEATSAHIAPQRIEPRNNKLIHPGDIPLQISVEVAQLNLSVHELLGLQPGNILNLQTPPESGVSLLLNGKQVGIGELVQVGDLLGIRIVKIHE